jgi:serine/threonine protein kinase
MDNEHEDNDATPRKDCAETTPAGDVESSAETPPLQDSLEPTPKHIPDYELIRVLGERGFGEVWLAKSRSGVYRGAGISARRRVER